MMRRTALLVVGLLAFATTHLLPIENGWEVLCATVVEVMGVIAVAVAVEKP